jgi:hypothetical protein
MPLALIVAPAPTGLYAMRNPEKLSRMERATALRR